MKLTEDVLSDVIKLLAVEHLLGLLPAAVFDQPRLCQDADVLLGEDVVPFDEGDAIVELVGLDVCAAAALGPHDLSDLAGIPGRPRPRAAAAAA